MDKIRIGENEYVFPIEVICADCLYDRDSGDWEDGRECKCDDAEMYYTIDAAGNHITPHEEMGIITALRQERDALVKRVEELTEVANYAANVCNAATISTSKSEETAYAIGMLERAICRPYQVNASERNTTQGGDELKGGK